MMVMSAFVATSAVTGCGDLQADLLDISGSWGLDVELDENLHDWDIEEADSTDKPVIPAWWHGYSDAVENKDSDYDVGLDAQTTDDSWEVSPGDVSSYDSFHEPDAERDVMDHEDVGTQTDFGKDSGGNDTVYYDVVHDSYADQWTDVSDQCQVDDYEYDGDASNGRDLGVDYPGVGSICPQGDVDYFVFMLDSTFDVTLETSGDYADDTLMVLYDSELREIASDDDDGAGRYSKIVAAGLGAGVYFVKVSAYGSTTVRSYALVLSLYDSSVDVDADAMEPTDANLPYDPGEPHDVDAADGYSK